MRIELFSLLTLFSFSLFSGLAFSATAETTKNDRVVKDGLMISLEYTLKSPDGKVLETSKGKEPLKYIHGQKMMIPGLEKELTGMKVGGEKNVTVKPEDGYGKINPKAVQEVPKEKIPANALKVGAVLAARSPEGMVVPMTVKRNQGKNGGHGHEPSDGGKDFAVRREGRRYPARSPTAPRATGQARNAGETCRSRRTRKTGTGNRGTRKKVTHCNPTRPWTCKNLPHE